MTYSETTVFETENFDFIVNFEYFYDVAEMNLELDNFNVFVADVKNEIQISNDLYNEIEEYLFDKLDGMYENNTIDYAADYNSMLIDQAYDIFGDR